MAHGDAREGRMEWVASSLTLPRNTVYPALLPLMSTPRLPAVDWTDAPAGLNGLVRFAEKPNLVSARVPSRFKRSVQREDVKDMSYAVTHLLAPKLLNRFQWNFALGCCVLSVGWFACVWILYADASGHSAYSILIGRVNKITTIPWLLFLAPLHTCLTTGLHLGSLPPPPVPLPGHPPPLYWSLLLPFGLYKYPSKLVAVKLLPWLRFSVIFLSCKANAKVYDAKSGHGQHSPPSPPRRGGFT